MSMHTLLQYKWSMMTPEFIVLITALILSLADLWMPNDKNRRPLAWIAVVGVVIALIATAGLIPAKPVSILYDTFRIDSFSKAFKLLVLAGGALCLLLALDYRQKKGFRIAASFTICSFARCSAR